jgi:DNA-binding PadR family transcriptional regulator
MYNLTAFQRDLLYVTTGEKKMSGLEIKDKMESYYKEEINHGRLYPNLDELTEMGLIEKGEQDKRTNYYTISERGQREIQAREEWQESQTKTSH